MAKSKVAPARARSTLPKLELCAAVLLARLMKKATSALRLQNINTYGWTDSMITLSWIKGDPIRWKTFVANRVAEIQGLLPSHFWHHVKTEDNPADIISRGIDPSKLKNHSIWWNGPTWLKENDQFPQVTILMQLPEERKTCHQTTVRHEDNDITERFSSLLRMIRVVSYCNRFIRYCKKNPKLEEFLSVQEMEDALRQIIKNVQHAMFKVETETLRKDKQVEKNSKMSTLSPFLDNDGVIRVGGRLQHSLLAYNEKHPIILPHGSHLATLVILDAHHKTMATKQH